MRTSRSIGPNTLSSQFRLIGRMYKFLSPVKIQVAITVIIYMAYVAAEVTAVRLLKPAVNTVKELGTVLPAEGNSVGAWEWLTADNGSGAQLRHALLWLALAKIILSILAWARSVSTTWQSMSMSFYMRAAVYDRLQRVGFSFYDQYSTGQLINRAIGDQQSVRNFIQTSLFSSLDIVFTMLGYFGMLYYDCSFGVSVAALIPLPFWVWVIRRYAVRSQPIYVRQTEASDEMVRRLTENIAGVHVVRAFATEALECEQFNKASESLLERVLEGIRLRVTMGPVIRGIAVASHITLFALGATWVQKGSLNVGDLVIFGVAMHMIFAKVQQINTISDAYQQAVVSSGRLFEILDNPNTTPELPSSEPLRPGSGNIRFSRVSFGYGPGRTTINDISFFVPAGSVVALVGPVGAGKTTLAALLARFYDPDLGKIEIDGQDIRDVSLRSIRQSVGYVFQETYLFNDTIARNIAYSDLSASLEKIQEAARIARADEFIEELPKKYDAMIGEYGATLSGGQRQRMAIARAILHNPRVLVLDDAFAAVDPETEAQIRIGLDKIMAGRTVFLITSRISTARRADQIMVVENGCLIQRGVHDELIDQPGYYRDVATCQFVERASGQGASHMDRMSHMSKRKRSALNEG